MEAGLPLRTLTASFDTSRLEGPMYLWNTDALAADLANGRLPERERIKYFLLYAVLTALAAEVSTYLGQAPSLPALTYSGLVVLTTLFGTIWIYRLNRAGAGQDFIGRYIILSIPIGVKLVALYILVGMPVLLIQAAMTKIAPGQIGTTWVDVIMGAAFLGLYFWRLGRQIRRIAEGQARSEQAVA